MKAKPPKIAGPPKEVPVSACGAKSKSASAVAGKIPHVAVTRSGIPAHFKGDVGATIAKMRNGTPARTIPGIALRLGISQDRLFDLLRLPKSTVKGRISADGMLSATEQDRVYRAEKALSRALQVLEDEAAAKEWLSQRNRSLGGELPLALLDTELGYELVLDTLGRIEHGVLS